MANTHFTAPLHNWAWPVKPWQRVHIDYAEHEGKHYFVLVDADAPSKWPEAIPMNSTTTEKTMTILRNLFAAYGLPEELVSNMRSSQFTSKSFAEFLRLIKHRRSGPYHPAANGAAERFVQVLKKSLKNKPGSLTMVDHLASFLLVYRSTPHTATGVSPAELFPKRPQRTRLSMVKPDRETAMHQKQQ